MTTDTWQKLIDIAEQRAGSLLTIWTYCSVYYNLCAQSVVTPFSLNAFNLWKRLNGTKNCDFESYMNLPALYVDICEVIESELSIVERELQNNNKNIVRTNMMK